MCRVERWDGSSQSRRCNSQFLRTVMATALYERMIGLVASLLMRLTEIRGPAIFASVVAAGRSSAFASEGNSSPYQAR